MVCGMATLRRLKTQQAEMRRRAERFLRWSQYYVLRNTGAVGCLSDRKASEMLTRVLLGAGRYLRRDSLRDHKNLVAAMQEAMPDVLEVSKSLAHDAPLRKSLDKLNHAITRALIREGL